MMSDRVRGRIRRPLRLTRPRAANTEDGDLPDITATRSPQRRQRIRALNRGDEQRPIVVETARHTSCIDLTSDVQDEEFVDLTNVSGVMESPVIIMSSSSDPERRSTRSSGLGDDVMRIEDADDNLPVFNLSDTQAASGPADDGDTAAANDSILSTPGRSVRCPVCFDSSKTVQKSGRRLMSTMCGHIFCSDCIQGAVDAQKRCPTCRKKLTMRQVHPIFL